MAVSSIGSGISSGATSFAAGTPVVPAPSPSDFLALSQCNHALQSQSLEQSLRAALAREVEGAAALRSECAQSRALVAERDESIAALRAEADAARAESAALRSDGSSRSALLDSLSGSVAQCASQSADYYFFALRRG